MKNNSKSLKNVIIIIIAIILIGVLAIFLMSNKKIKLTVDNVDINFSYSKLEYKQIEKNEKMIKLESKKYDITIKNESINDVKYNELKEYKKMVYNGEEKQYKNVSFLVYRNENNYYLNTPISDNYYLEICIVGRDNANKSVDEVLKEKSINKMLNSFKIAK